MLRRFEIHFVQVGTAVDDLSAHHEIRKNVYFFKPLGPPLGGGELSEITHMNFNRSAGVGRGGSPRKSIEQIDEFES